MISDNKSIIEKTDLIGLSIILLITGIGEIMLINIFSFSSSESIVIFLLSLIGIFVIAWVLVTVSKSLGESCQKFKQQKLNMISNHH